MPTLTESTGGDMPPPPAAGAYVALCTHHQYGQMEFPVWGDNGPTGERETRPGLQYTFVLQDAQGTIHEVRTKRMKFTPKAHPRSNLVQFFKSWLGEIPENTEAAVGQAAYVSLVHSEDGRFANFAQISPCPPELMTKVNELRLAMPPQAAAAPAPVAAPAPGAPAPAAQAAAPAPAAPAQQADVPFPQAEGQPF